MYAVTQGTFRTPRGRSVTMRYREDTNDFNVLRSCLDEDEYGLRDLTMGGQALDIGAHIGGVTIALAVDNPDLHVTAVEAVPPNIDLLRENVELNRLSERVEVIHAAAGKSGKVKWGFAGSGDVGSHNAFVGNALIDLPVVAHEHMTLPTRSQASLIGDGVEFVKIDCEGCEWDMLTPSLKKVARIHGEWHPTDGHTRQDISAALSKAGYTFTFSGPLAGPGGFEAWR
jgi:FkbM family methyltransferase